MYPAGFDYMAPPPPYPGPPQNWAAPPQNWTATAPPSGNFSVLFFSFRSSHPRTCLCFGSSCLCHCTCQMWSVSFFALILNHVESFHPHKRGRTADCLICYMSKLQKLKSPLSVCVLLFFFFFPHTLWRRVQTAPLWVEPGSVLRCQFGISLF